MGMLQNLTGWHAIIILAVILLLFGATKLPALAKSVGQSMKIFKTELKDAAAPATQTDPVASDPTATEAAPVVVVAGDGR